MIISGDNQGTVDSIADCLSMDRRHGDLLPDQKLRLIEEAQGEGLKVAMVGDGINDAPALAQADVGISMGASGTNVALETADVSIMNDDLTKILVLHDVQKMTNRIVRQSIWLSITIKLTFAVLTVAGLMTLALAVGIGDMGVSLLVILNAFRIFTYKSRYRMIYDEKLDVLGTKIYCENCKTTSSYPQHHGREMVQRGELLVCWKSTVGDLPLEEACTAANSLRCSTCSRIQHVK